MTYLAELAGNAPTARQKDQAAAECFRKKGNNVFKRLGFLSVAKIQSGLQFSDRKKIETQVFLTNFN